MISCGHEMPLSDNDDAQGGQKRKASDPLESIPPAKRTPLPEVNEQVLRVFSCVMYTGHFTSVWDPCLHALL